MKSVCVFLGSSLGKGECYVKAAEALGKELAGRGLTTVFGGTDVGLMSVLARAALEQGGRVVGIIPRILAERKMFSDRLTELHVVDSLHERKIMMERLADGFIALPGGLGTLDELFDIITGAQLGFHRKPCGLLNVQGYYDRLFQFLDQAVGNGFIAPEYRGMLMSSDRAPDLLDQLDTYCPAGRGKWSDEQSSSET